ncbi:SDR family oxidoreductase [Nannocystis sp. bb15-2]|uniref:SDR family oxidoreductase n=2 Tax=Nannocystis bainbridge TaxID=2995303 RepID=A0ABT5DSQ3_9BACT|nr:SDR family oxidoreductase [Nannocystis bainbridge]MDC0716666.1 SDR family oxidoreductase [Nannocystis bainbridge]
MPPWNSRTRSVLVTGESIMANWKTTDIPAQKGRLAVVSGTGGLGLEDALGLARAGSEVIIAGRNPQKGADAVARVLAEVPSAIVRFEHVDLASLESVAGFAARLRSQSDRIDLLINNAAVMTPPSRQETSDGFELQFGTNYLGHFALTAQLMPLLRNGTSPRIVTLSSVAARDGALAFDDLQAERSYAPMRAYGQSKLACLMFALELQRRSEANRWGVTSIAAHPGISRTDLLHNAPGRWSAAGLARTLLWFMFQPASQGALPTLFAATSPEARAGAYYGPDRLGEMRGSPALAKVPPRAEDRAAAERLWRVSEQLTGVSFA